MMRRRLALFVLTGSLFLSREAYLSQVHYKTITLAELIARSELVLVVKTAQPAQRQIPIPIGKDQKKQEAPAFVRVELRCAVQSAISLAGTELTGKTIEI